MIEENNEVEGEGLDFEQELADMLTTESEEVTDAVQFDPDSPHWSVSRDDILRILRIIASLPAKSTIFMALWKDGNRVRVHANNKDAFIDSALDILNENPYETDKVYFVDSKMLQTFIQSYSSFCFSFDDKGSIIFESPYTVYQLETYNLSLADMQIKPEEGLVYSVFPLNKQQTNVFKALFAFAPSLNDNKVLVKPDRVLANFTLYQHSLIGPTAAAEPFILRRVDIPTIAEVADLECQFALTEKRVYIQYTGGLISFLRLPYNEKEIVIPETYATGETQGDFQIDVKMLRKALKLTSILSTSTVDFEQDGDNILLLAGSRARFQIGKGSIKETFSLSTELFTKIVATLDSNEIFVTCKVTEKGIEISLEKDKVINYSLSRTTVGALKRKEKIAKKLENRVERKAALQEKGKLAENLADTAQSIDDVIGDL